MMVLLKQIFRAATVTPLLCGILSLQAADNNVHVYGRLTATMCDLVVDQGGLDSVVFPQMAASDLALRGRSPSMPVILRLTNCGGLTLENGVRVTFSGVEESGLAGYLALDGTSLAEGFAIGLETQQGKQVLMNNSTGATFMLNEGSNTLILNAWLQTVPAKHVTPGTFTATATATFEYL